MVRRGQVSGKTLYCTVCDDQYSAAYFPNHVCDPYKTRKKNRQRYGHGSQGGALLPKADLQLCLSPVTYTK